MRNKGIKHLQMIISKWRIILISILSFAFLSIIYSYFFLEVKYEAEVKVFIGKEKFNNVAEVYNNEEVTMYQQLLKTYSELSKTNTVLKATIKEAKINLSISDLKNNLSVSPITDTQVLKFKFKNKDKQIAYDTMYGFTKVFIIAAEELYPNGNVKVLEQVSVERSDIESEKLMITIIGVILGLGFGVGLVLLLIIMNNTFVNKEEVEEEFGIMVLGIIPIIEE